MIDFVILHDNNDTTALEFCRAYVGFDCTSARYSSEVRQYTPEQIAALERKAIPMRDPESGDLVRIAPLFVSDKVKEREDAGAIFKRHVGAYVFGHPLRFVIAKALERMDA